jgi:hypothetical protein
MPSYSGDYDIEYDYEAETDFQDFDGKCLGEEEEEEYGYGIDTDSFYIALDDVYYGGDHGTTKKASISKRMSVYIPDLGLTPTYFKEYTREEINSYFVNYLSRVLCSPYDPIVKKVHKVHTKLNRRTDTISCCVYVEWYNDEKTWFLQKDIKDKNKKVSVKFTVDGFEWKLRKNCKPVGDFNYEEKLRAEITGSRWGKMYAY